MEKFTIKTKDEVTICTPPDMGMITPYVLLEQKEWYENELGFIRDYLKPGMAFIDVGAGFGVYALPAAKWVGEDGKVFSFEPGAVAKNYLEKSKLENGFQNMEIIGKAVSDKAGKQSWKTAETPELNKLDESGEEEVQTIILDSWWQFEGEPKVDFLKVDVNGSEADVLKGATELLKSELPVVLISITDQKTDAFVEELKKRVYKLYKYIPGSGILAEHDVKAGVDPYMQNLIAIPESRIEDFKNDGWLHNESISPKEVEKDHWKAELRKLPWTHELMEQWESHSQSDGMMSYLQALNYLIAAEQIYIHDPELDQPRNQKAVLQLEAAQMLIQLYNQGANSTSVVFTLVRALNALGKRGQAVEVMQKLIESTKFGQENMNVDLPFLLPIPEQDNAPIKTDLSKWLMVRTVEAWIFLKDLTTYFSGEQARKLLEVLEGNPEVITRLNDFNKLKSPDTPTVERNNGITNGVQNAKKSQPKVVHLCFNHVYAQSLADLIEHVNEHSDQQHRLYIETQRAIPNYSVEIDNNPASTLFNFKTKLQSIAQECLKEDVDMVMFHGIFFDWQKKLIHTIGDKKHIGWKLWGGDLYNPIKNGKPLTDLMKLVDSVHARVEGDFEIIEETYGKKLFSRFGYTFPGLYEDIPDDIEKDTPKRIIIGNSGDPENEHVEILKILASKKDIQDYQLLIPVAYNLPRGYKQVLVNTIKELGLHSITELHDQFIHPRDYVELVMRSRMLITAHNRQQAIGSILTSLYGGNNTFIKKEINLNGKKITNPTWRYVLDHNLEAQPFEELKKVDRLAEIKEIDHDFRKRQQEIIRNEVGIETRGKELINAVATICS
ncbi:MAG: TDP-N-acetylfucosamine:lipid II N-acetylfucosaminyltransferase [Gracilimonas sp.]